MSITLTQVWPLRNTDGQFICRAVLTGVAGLWDSYSIDTDGGHHEPARLALYQAAAPGAGTGRPGVAAGAVWGSVMKRDIHLNLPEGNPAYAETAAAITAEMMREHDANVRFDMLTAMLKNRKYVGATFKVPAGPWAPIDAPREWAIVQDFAAWLNNHRDPASAIADFMLGGDGELIEQYALARIEAEQKEAA